MKYYHIIKQKEPERLTLSGSINKVSVDTFTIHLDYSENQLYNFKNMLFIGRHEFIEQGSYPTALYLGYENYKKLMALISQHSIGVLEPNTYCDLKIIIVPNDPYHLSFGYSNPIDQFHHEILKGNM